MDNKLWKDGLNFGIPPVLGVAGAIVAFRIQENAYGRPNEMAQVSAGLGNPDYLTSFAYPLCLMWLLRFVALEGEMENRSLGHKNLEKFFRQARWLIPVAVAMINVAYEVTSRPAYHDNPTLDILAGFAAAGVGLGLEALTARTQSPTSCLDICLE